MRILLEAPAEQRTQCVVNQYNNYEIAGVHLNGANTTGENIADIGGVKLALTGYRALRASSPDTIFLGFGQAWCQKARPEYEKLLATVDVHSPAKWRVNGAVSDTPEFARAFSCKANTKMHPANACVVW